MSFASETTLFVWKTRPSVLQAKGFASQEKPFASQTMRFVGQTKSVVPQQKRSILPLRAFLSKAMFIDHEEFALAAPAKAGAAKWKHIFQPG